MTTYWLLGENTGSPKTVEDSALPEVVSCCNKSEEPSSDVKVGDEV
jgi:hypothetical protein